MRAENLTWIGEPTDKYDEKHKCWPRWTLWPFKTKFDGKECDTRFVMNETDHDVYLAEKAILEELSGYVGDTDETKTPDRKKLLALIEAYGDKREEKGRHDMSEDWAERDAGAGV